MTTPKATTDLEKEARRLIKWLQWNYRPLDPAPTREEILSALTKAREEGLRGRLICEVCWHSAFVPVEPGSEDGYEHATLGLGWVRCDYCWIRQTFEIPTEQARKEGRLAGLEEGIAGCLVELYTAGRDGSAEILLDYQERIRAAIEAEGEK